MGCHLAHYRKLLILHIQVNHYLLLLLLSWLGWTGGLINGAITGVYSALLNLFY